MDQARLAHRRTARKYRRYCTAGTANATVRSARGRSGEGWSHQISASPTTPASIAAAMRGYGPVSRYLSWMVVMRATLTDRRTVRLPRGRDWRRRTKSTSPISTAGWTKKPAMPAARYAWLPVLVVSVTHIVPYGLAYSVKNVRSERTSVNDTTRGI